VFSKSCEYAIRAVVFISSRKNDSPIVKINEIAESVEAPAYYTSKILQQLVKQKIIGSMKGQNGGFYIDENLKEIRLIDIVNAIDGDSIFNGCGLGLKSCSETNPCPLHDRFKQIRSDLKDMLMKTKISDLSENYLNGKSTLKKTIGKIRK